jgi:hypothetical protein
MDIAICCWAAAICYTLDARGVLVLKYWSAIAIEDYVKKQRKLFSTAGPLIVGLALVGYWMGSPGLVRAQADEAPMSDLRFVVVRDYNGKPVRNAAVILHPVTKKGRQSRGGMELKTDNEGRTNIDGIPYGPLRIQVLAPGFQTFGEDYEINKPALEITVKLKRPGGQFSTYEGSADAKKADDKKTPDPKPQPQPQPQQ